LYVKYMVHNSCANHNRSDSTVFTLSSYTYIQLTTTFGRLYCTGWIPSQQL